MKMSQKSKYLHQKSEPKPVVIVMDKNEKAPLNEIAHGDDQDNMDGKKILAINLNQVSVILLMIVILLLIIILSRMAK